MASVFAEIQLDASSDDIWEEVRDIGAAHDRMVASLLRGPLTDREVVRTHSTPQAR